MDVGDFEYWKIKPVLESVDSPSQLHLIESNSPQIRGEDAELWQKFIARDISKWEEKSYVPRSPLNWYKVYRKYKKEQEAKIRQDEEELKARMAGIQKERGKNVSKLVDMRLLPKMPRDPKMQYNAGVKIARKGGLKNDSPSILAWTSGSKTKLTNGKSVLTRARREAKEIKQMSRLSMPTHKLAGKVGEVRKAPTSMVDEYIRAAQPETRIFSKRKAAPGTVSMSGPSLEEREARLYAMQRTSRHMPRGTVVDSSESEEEAGSMDAIFDNQSNAHRAPAHSSSRPNTTQGYSGRPQPSSSSSSSRTRGENHAAQPKPSDVILSVLSKPNSKSLPRSMGSLPASSLRSSPAGFRRSPSPSQRERKPPLIQRKRPEVDVFNRKVKRLRAG